MMASVVAAPVRIAVRVVVERRRASSQWIDFTWKPVMILFGRPQTAPWTVLSMDAEVATFYVGLAEIRLYRTESGNYSDNLASGLPSLWIAMRPTGLEPPYELCAVTADPAEGESFTQAGNDPVGTVPIPPAVREIVAAFIAAHPIEQPVHKRSRDQTIATDRRREIADDLSPVVPRKHGRALPA
jgi:hypothetical protein